MSHTVTAKSARTVVAFGRVCLVLSFLKFVGAWLSELSGGAVLGFSQQHLFSDAIVFSLLGIGLLLDALWHDRRV